MIQTDTLKSGYKILQDTERFQFGIDAILLADFTSQGVKPGQKIIDLGTGTGIIPLVMASRFGENVSFTGLEVQKESADMAAQSVAINQLEKRISIINGDLKKVSEIFERHSFNVVTCNPPYMINEHGVSNELDAMSIARHELLCNLEDVISATDYLLAPHGRFFMIHRPFRLPEIFESLSKHKLEAKRMRLIHPFPNKEPNLVMIEARKNAKRRLSIEPPLVVRDNTGPNAGNYTSEIQEIYEK